MMKDRQRIVVVRGSCKFVYRVISVTLFASICTNFTTADMQCLSGDVLGNLDACKEKMKFHSVT